MTTPVPHKHQYHPTEDEIKQFYADLKYALVYCQVTTTRSRETSENNEPSLTNTTTTNNLTKSAIITLINRTVISIIESLDLSSITYTNIKLTADEIMWTLHLYLGTIVKHDQADTNHNVQLATDKEKSLVMILDKNHKTLEQKQQRTD